MLDGTELTFTRYYNKVTMKLRSMVVLVLMVQTCIESLAIILPFICPDCITGFSPSQTDRDRLVCLNTQIIIYSDEDAGFAN